MPRLVRMAVRPLKAVKRLGLTAAFGLLFVFAEAQENYKKIFSVDYDKAVRFLKDDEKWMDEMILAHQLKPKEIKAVIFPELLRYNSIQDKIETFALESLYIRYGKAYANFSIGPFQIKPSFAENVEIDFLKIFGPGQFQVARADTIQNATARDTRLKKLRDKKAMVGYLCLFFKIMEQKYPQWKTEEEKIKFFACAYNFEYRKSQQEITEAVSRKFFHTGLIANRNYCYAEIALYFFKNE